MSGVLHVAHEDRMAALVAAMGLRPEPAAFDRTDRILLQAVAALSLLTPDDITGREKTLVMVRGRQLFALVAQTALRRTLSAIAETLNRDHSTVVHMLKRGRERMAGDPDFALVFVVLTARFVRPDE